MYAQATPYTGNQVAGSVPTYAQPPSAFPPQPPSAQQELGSTGAVLSAGGDANWPWSRTGDIVTLHPTSEPLPAAPRSLRTMLVMYENERYSPRLGFSSKGLILGDRAAFSTDDGTIGFATLKEMTQSMLAKGWDYEGDWMIASALNAIDKPYTTAGREDGWLYNADFASYATSAGQVKKGMTHFVRRRKLVRMQVFDERTLCDNMLCQSCDLRRLEQLVPLLFETLWKALRAHYGTRELKADKIVKVKTLMTKALLSLPPTTFSHGAVAQQLDAFVRSQGSSTVPNVMPAADVAKLLDHYSVLERESVVRSLIRHLDRSFAYHCPEQHCGTACQFAVHRCPNNGCSTTFSMKWWGEHDANCPWKDILCPLQCGRVVVRKNAEAHMAQECIMRPVPCPYARVGCAPPGLIFRDVQAHCSLNHPYHLSLTTATIDRTVGEIASLRSMERSIQAQIAAAEASLRR